MNVLCISFKSWNQEHPIQQIRALYTARTCCVYPSNLEIKNILYNAVKTYQSDILLCISFKFWNQEHPIQQQFPNLPKERVVYILQILKSRTSYTTIAMRAAYLTKLCISFKFWNQEHPIQLIMPVSQKFFSCVYPSNFEIKNILYNSMNYLDKKENVVYILQILKSRTSYTTKHGNRNKDLRLCISFKFWNQEHPIQRFVSVYCWNAVVYILQILKSRTSYTTPVTPSQAVPCCVYPSNFEIKNILYNFN